MQIGEGCQLAKDLMSLQHDAVDVSDLYDAYQKHPSIYSLRDLCGTYTVEGAGEDQPHLISGLSYQNVKGKAGIEVGDTITSIELNCPTQGKSVDIEGCFYKGLEANVTVQRGRERERGVVSKISAFPVNGDESSCPHSIRTTSTGASVKITFTGTRDINISVNGTPINSSTLLPSCRSYNAERRCDERPERCAWKYGTQCADADDMIVACVKDIGGHWEDAVSTAEIEKQQLPPSTYGLKATKALIKTAAGGPVAAGPAALKLLAWKGDNAMNGGDAGAGGGGRKKTIIIATIVAVAVALAIGIIVFVKVH